MNDLFARPAPPPAFDYTSVGANVATDLRAAADRIRDRVRASVIETGLDLLQVKDRLEHGHFIAWLEAECALNDRTAQRMMTAARWVEGKTDTLSYLPPTALYALSAPSTPTDVQERLVARIEAGESLAPDHIKAEIAQAKEEAAKARKRAKLSPKQIAAKKAAEARREKRLEKHDRQWEERRDRRERGERDLVDFLVEHIADTNTLCTLLSEACLIHLKDKVASRVARPGHQHEQHETAAPNRLVVKENTPPARVIPTAQAPS